MEKCTQNGRYPLSGSNECKRDRKERLSLLNTSGIADRSVEGIDISKGLEKYDNDESVYVKILSSYAANTHISLDAIYKIDIVSEENLDDYRLRVHSIKGTSLDIYAEGIGKKAAQLEQMAKDGDLESINKENPTFLTNAKELIDGIDKLLLEIDAASPKPVRGFPDKKLLLKLKDACENYSMDGVNDAMDEIEKYKYDSDDGLADWLREQINVMAFGLIAGKLSGIVCKKEV